MKNIEIVKQAGDKVTIKAEDYTFDELEGIVYLKGASYIKGDIEIRIKFDIVIIHNIDDVFPIDVVKK